MIKKSVTIFNFINDHCSERRNNDSQTVVFLGAISESKGFYELCRIWPGILKDVPEAKLKVIGSGQLYGNAVMGRYGIAKESYEKKFMPFITDASRNILPSVKFLGIQGAEKIDTFLNASVGVVNPARNSETFGMGIIEMATAKLPVVTRKKNGYLDTVESGRTGFLGSSLSEIQKNIILLLKNRMLNEQLGAEAKRFIVNFSPEVIVPQWKDLLDAVYDDKLQIEYSPVRRPYSNNLKWVRCVLRFLRFDMHLSFLPALIDLESLAYLVVQKIKSLR